MDPNPAHLRTLGEIPPSHADRFGFLPNASREDLSRIDLGVLFIMSFWSGPSRLSFNKLKEVLAQTDPEGKLELLVVSIDDAHELCELPEFSNKVGGYGEAAWIKKGQIVATTEYGFHPELFEPLTRDLLGLPALPDTNPKVDPIWCVVANVRWKTAVEAGQQKSRTGTKHFAPGAKVYCFPTLWGDGYEQIKVIGRHRGSHRYVTMIIGAKYLTKWRAELVHSPHVIYKMKGHWDGTEQSKSRAQDLVQFKVKGHWGSTGQSKSRAGPDRTKAATRPVWVKWLVRLFGLK